MTMKQLTALVRDMNSKFDVLLSRNRERQPWTEPSRAALPFDVKHCAPIAVALVGEAIGATWRRNKDMTVDFFYPGRPQFSALSRNVQADQPVLNISVSNDAGLFDDEYTRALNGQLTHIFVVSHDNTRFTGAALVALAPLRGWLVSHLPHVAKLQYHGRASYYQLPLHLVPADAVVAVLAGDHMEAGRIRLGHLDVRVKLGLAV